MGASITLAGESLIAQKLAANAGLKITKFIFANVPGLDPNGPIDRAGAKPKAAQIVYTYAISSENAGYVNPNQVVYSAQIGSDVGDWDFNWIGLETAEGTLFAVAYVPLQQKRRNVPPLQVGNNVTRNFLVVFDGAQGLTGITIDARTWQHDFTVRLAGIDERERQSNRDVFGRACFFGSSLQVEKIGSAYRLRAGTAYVEGIRLQRLTTLAIVPPSFPTTVWLDVSLQRELSDVVTNWQVVFGAAKTDYTDDTGVRHYCVALAELPNAEIVTDSRSVEPISGSLVEHFAARSGDYVGLRARSTTKEDVGLGNLPNAKSDFPTTDNSLVLATSKAVRAVFDRLIQATEATLGMVKLATQAHVNVGVNDLVAVTPKTLNFGFSISLGQNGYIILPSWLGGFIAQWGSGLTGTAISFPIAFPYRVGGIVANHSGGTYAGVSVLNSTLSLKGFNSASSTGNGIFFYWIAIGG